MSCDHLATSSPFQFTEARSVSFSLVFPSSYTEATKMEMNTGSTVTMHYVVLGITLPLLLPPTLPPVPRLVGSGVCMPSTGGFGPSLNLGPGQKHSLMFKDKNWR